MYTVRDPNTPEPPRRGPWIAAAVVVVLAVIIGAAALLLLRGSDDQTTTPATGQLSGATDTPAFAVSKAGLRTLANAVPDPIYWAGPRNSTLYEITKKANGNVILRYLPKGAKAGYSGAVVSVGTYPFNGAYATAQQLLTKPGTIAVPVQEGALAFHDSRSKTNVYVVFPGMDYQIEVFSPEPGEAAKIVSAGQISRVTAAPQ